MSEANTDAVRILLVEDEEPVLRSIERFFSRNGFVVFGAQNPPIGPPGHPMGRVLHHREPTERPHTHTGGPRRAHTGFPQLACFVRLPTLEL